MISATIPTSIEFNKPAMANVTFDRGDKTVSLCCDNSAGAMGPELRRSDIRLLIRESGRVVDVTSNVFGGGEEDVVPATISAMEEALRWLRRTGWGGEHVV
jgi:hypothetical protein